ncbi:4'-phosphopantetheinyl transferase family protein [Streptomyces yangpuensis]|uniref:4'-phosphopantetheinyl transferase family protein n=1 Tax=Streptomyces yangpuensis TaxID=1648182 RepID=UPI000699D3AF|nr:4'-phosphopantetheinyl transferase superfamily protein [Streptomyces yangpuensis]
MTAGAAQAVPALRPGACQLWWASAGDAHPRLGGLLDKGERARADRLRRPADRALHLTAHALARTVAAAQLGIPAESLPLTAVCKRCGGPHGKPQPPLPVRLSWSHSGERVVVALSLGTEIGVDVERIAPFAPETAERVLCAPERTVLAALPAVRRPEGFVRYWTRKEALLKATGDGLAVAPELLHLTPPDAPPRLLSWSGPDRPRLPLHLYDLDAGTGYLAALAASGAPVRPTQHDGSALLAAVGAPTAVPGTPGHPTLPVAERPLAS